jgi:hypothetical protein
MIHGATPQYNIAGLPKRFTGKARLRRSNCGVLYPQHPIPSTQKASTTASARYWESHNIVHQAGADGSRTHQGLLCATPQTVLKTAEPTGTQPPPSPR